jgi:hypothetical protein
MRGSKLTPQRRMWTARGTVAAAPMRTHVITYETWPAGGIKKPADTTGYGSVAYKYRFGKHDDAIGHYTAFLNAVATNRHVQPLQCEHDTKRSPNEDNGPTPELYATPTPRYDYWPQPE